MSDLVSMDELKNMTRKKLQALAKAGGIKANLSTDKIIAALVESGVVLAPNDNISKGSIVQLSEESILPSNQPQSECVKADNANCTTDTTKEPEPELVVGSVVEAFIDSEWDTCTIKRVNKKSLRVVRQSNHKEYTVKLDEVRAFYSSTSMTGESKELQFSKHTPLPTSPKVDAIMQPTLKEDVTLVEEIVAEATHNNVKKTRRSAKQDVPSENITSAVEHELSTITFEEITKPSCVTAKSPNSKVYNEKPLWDSSTKPLSKDRESLSKHPIKLAAPMENAVVAQGSNRIVHKDQSSTASFSKRKSLSLLAETADIVAPATVLSSHAKSQSFKPPSAASVKSVKAGNTANALVGSIKRPPAPAPTPSSVVSRFSSTTGGPANTHGSTGTLQPKSNKALALRLEMLQRKLQMTAEKNQITPVGRRASVSSGASVSANPFAAVCTSASATTSSASKKRKQDFRVDCTTESGNKKPVVTSTKRASMSTYPSSGDGSKPYGCKVRASCVTASSTRSDATPASTSAPKKAIGKTPDFKKLHSKQFNSLKSIAEGVDRDADIDRKMSAAVATEFEQLPQTALFHIGSTEDASKNTKPSPSITMRRGTASTNHKTLKTISRKSKPSANISTTVSSGTTSFLLSKENDIPSNTTENSTLIKSFVKDGAICATMGKAVVTKRTHPKNKQSTAAQTHPTIKRVATGAASEVRAKAVQQKAAASRAAKASYNRYAGY